MGQAGLASPHPLLIHHLAITDQNAHPPPNEVLEGLGGAVRVNQKKGHTRVGHHPQPVQLAPLIPGRFVQMVQLGFPGLLPDRLIMGRNRRRRPVHHFLNGA